MYSYIIIIVGLLSLIVIETLPMQLTSSSFLSHINIISNAIAQQTVSTNTTIVNDNLKEEQQNNESKTVKAFGHFANNQIKDGIVTWIQGGYWNLIISNIINDNNSLDNNNIVINNSSNSSSKANFIANFTMIKPDGSLSHNHNIKNFISDKVIVTDKDIVVMGIADIYSDNDIISEYKNVPLTIHLMGKQVLGLTMNVSKTEGHFASPNEMFGTLISGVGLDTSATAIPNSTQKMMVHNDTATNDTIEEGSMAMMQH